MVSSLQVKTAISRIMAISISSSVLLLLLITLPVKCAPVIEKQYLSDFEDALRMHGNGKDLKKNAELLKELRTLLSSVQIHRGVTGKINNFPNLPDNQSSVLQNNRDFGTLDMPQISKVGRSNTGTKRQLKFNPTGWRKKRSTDEYAELENLLKGTEQRDAGDNSEEDEIKLLPISTKLRLLLKPVIIRRNGDRAGQSIERLDSILAHLRSYLAKRKSGKPLDFNPTGW